MRIALRRLLILPCVLTAAVAAAQQNQTKEPPMLGIHWQRGAAPRAATGEARSSKPTGCSDCMTYHGGKILPTTSVYAIYWGTSWATPSFVQDKIAGIEQWYTEYPGSDYEKGTMSEYCSGATVGSTTCPASGTFIQTGAGGVKYSAAQDTTDTTTAGSGAKTSTILTEVCKVIQNKVSGNGGFTPTANDYYAVYVDLPVSGGYCAYHSYGTCSYTPVGGSATNVSVQFGFFWNADGNTGCASGDGPFTQTETIGTTQYMGSALTGHSEGLGSLIDSTAHELSETRTDPGSPTAWIDANGLEIGDKCEWNTGYPGQNQTTGIPVVQFTSSKWVMQPEWSNQAAIGNNSSNNTLYPWAQQSLNRKGTASGSYACVYGTTYPAFE